MRVVTPDVVRVFERGIVESAVEACPLGALEIGLDVVANVQDLMWRDATSTSELSEDLRPRLSRANLIAVDAIGQVLV